MTAVQTHDLPNWLKHYTVCVGNCIIVFGGDKKPALDNIYMYNLYTEQWRKYVIPDDKVAPHNTESCCALTWDTFVYIFGGIVFKKNRARYTNAVWKLTTAGQCFIWSKAKTRSRKKTPSPKIDHSGWVYLGKLWTFGGNGDDPAYYLNENGDFYEYENGYENNQVFCFDLSSQKWTNPKSHGTVPSPRSCHASTVVRDHAWVFGGYSHSIHHDLYELYQFDLISLTWTEIQIHLTKPESDCYTLSAVSQHQIMLHGSQRADSPGLLNDTWVLDLQSLSWKQHTANKKCACHYQIDTSGAEQ